MKKVKENLREIRKNNNLTQEQFGNIIGRSKGQMWNYENGSVDVPASVIYDVAEKFKVDILYIMTGENQEIEPKEKYDAKFRVQSASDRNIIAPILVANGYDVGQHKEPRKPDGAEADYYIHLKDNPDNINTVHQEAEEK